MKRISKVLVFILVLSISFSGISGTFADSKISVSRDVVKISEFELYSNLQAKSNDELIKMGYGKKQIEFLRNFDFEKKLRERAKLDKKFLAELGYSKEEIENLKNTDLSMKLNGGSDSGGVFATLTLETSKDYKTDDTVVVDFNWEWNHAPIYSGHDIVGISWEGVNNYGSDLQLRINRDYTYHKITMQKPGGTEIQNANIDVDNEYHAASFEFDMSYPVSSYTSAYAVSGEGQIMVNTTGTLPLNEMGMNIEYGHQAVTGYPSVDFSSGLSMSFDIIMAELAGVSDVYR